MSRCFSTIFSVIQMLIVVAVYAAPKLNTADLNFHISAFSFQNVAVKLNFPLAAAWSIVFYTVERLNPYLPDVKGLLFVPALIVVAALLASSVAVFWYFVLTEVEMRRHGRSMLRFNGWFKEISVAGFLFCFGSGTLLHAYSYATSTFYFHPIEVVFGAFFLVAWGVTLVGLSVYDILSFQRNNGQWPVSATKQQEPVS
jgi:hypothetical protein